MSQTDQNRLHQRGHPHTARFTVRHRTARTKGLLSQDMARLMVFKLVMAAARTWRRLKGENQLPKVIDGVRFKDGIKVSNVDAKDAA